MYIDPLLPLVPRQKWESWPKHLSARRIRYLPLSQLLVLPHDTDAHLGAYSAPSQPRRLCTDPPAYERIDGGVPMCVYLIDVDCAASHRATGGTASVRADDAWWSQQRRRFEALDAEHPGGFFYRTRGGARAIFRLPVPLVILDGAGEIAWKRRYLATLAYLARRFNIVADPAISDWTRLIRLPHVTRDGVFARAEVVGDPYDVGALDAPDDDPRDVEHARTLVAAVPAWAPALRILARNAAPPARRERQPRAVEPRPALDVGTWAALAADLGRALRRHHGRHLVHLALAGACYARGVPLERGPELARAICAASDETDDRPQVWQTTADRVRAGQPVTGFGHLAQHWPDLAAIVDTALPSGGGARAARDELDRRGVAVAIPAADAAELVRATLAGAPPGLSLVRVTEGAGKTQAAVDVLRARAEACATMDRIPSARKTVYVAPTHLVAAEVAAKLQGLRGLYLRSVLATGECAYHVPLSAVVRARHAVQTWCEGRHMGRNGDDDPCKHLDGCPARANAIVPLGRDGSPAICVTVHSLLQQALDWAGPDALVLIDEDPEAVEAAELRRGQLDAAAAAEDLFATTERFRAPVLRALAAGLDRGELPKGEGALAEVFERGCAALAGDASWQADVARFYDDPAPAAVLRSYAVRVAWHERRQDDGTSTWRRRAVWAPLPSRRSRAAVFNGGASDRFTAVSEAHAVVGRLAAGVVRAAPEGRPDHRERAVAAVEVDPYDVSRRVLRAVIASPAVSAAIYRNGPTVLLDATADVAVVRALAQGDVPVTDVRAADGAPVTRRLLFWSGASRRTALAEGDVRWRDGLERYLRAGLTQAIDAGARRVGLFTWKALADVLRQGDDPVARAILDELAALGVELVIGHYGNARSRDDWKACDALVSVGDPRPNLGATRAIAAVLGLAAEHAEVYRRATAAEVSQVSGRLRAPWRTSRALHVHVGTVTPASWDAGAEVIELPKGTAVGVDPVAVLDAVRVYGSQRLGAAAVGVTDRTARTLSHAGNALLEECHKPGSVTPTKNTSMAAPFRPCDTLKTQRFSDAAPLIDASGGAPAVARLLGVGRATVYHWRSGARPMPDDARQRLTAALQASEATGAPSEQPRAAPGPLRFTVPTVGVASGA